MAKRVRTLANIANQLREGASFSITRLTTIKTLCANPGDAENFALHVASQVGRQLHAKKRRNTERFILAVDHAVTAMRRHLSKPNPEDVQTLHARLFELRSLQDEYKENRWGPIRLIHCVPALVVEHALRCMLAPTEAPQWAYEMARCYAERSDPQFSTGLIPASAPMVEDIAAFWCKHHLGMPLQTLLKSASRHIRQHRDPGKRRMAASPFAKSYPAISWWTMNQGWIELGENENHPAFIKALDQGGLVCAGRTTYSSVDEALKDMEHKLARWLQKNLDWSW